MAADGFQSGAFQHTVKSPALFAGVGVHTGAYTQVAVRAGDTDSGVVFVRTDVLDRDNRVPVSPEAVCKTQLGTVITNGAGVTVATIEHLMAALVMTGIDNAVVELDGPEMPIMDGSAEPFVRLLDRAGKRPQAAARRFIEILAPVEVVDGDKRAALKPTLGGFEVAFEIRFPTRVIGRQAIDLPMTEVAFRRELADCRTFGFL
ncbi:MAG TPA: UDP-3-O-acyl-N-acetylglucosamine deacetylase, partial [Phenylobacterium sp.]|uniref:UDP-3-O-acyl-N-acetylglucosamine deacetylase n=1 Tax=Phenylobacterium sp. TaxID=1871053 RepID=UPI002D2709CD